MSRDRSGDLDGAIEVYRQSLELSPAQKLGLEVELCVADCLRRAGKADEAIAECSRIEKGRGGSEARLFAVRGLARASRGDTGLAVEDLATAVAMSPDEGSFQDFLERVRNGERFNP